MKSRAAALLFGLVSLLTAASAAAQMEPRIAIEIISPGDGTNIHQPSINFAWNAIDAVSYTLKVWSIDGLQTTKIQVLDSSCGGICAGVFNAGNEDWTWRKNTDYRWQVKARDAGGVVIGKSLKSDFMADMLPEVTLIDPTDLQHFEYEAGGSIQFGLTWERDNYDSFRVVVWKENGQVYADSGWGGTATYYCDLDNVCSEHVQFSTYKPELREYTWRVYGKRQFVAGKGKSEIRRFSIASLGQ